MLREMGRGLLRGRLACLGGWRMGCLGLFRAVLIRVILRECLLGRVRVLGLLRRLLLSYGNSRRTAQNNPKNPKNNSS